MTDAGGKHGMRKAFVGKAEALLDECHIERTPVDLLRIARHLGIQRIRELDVRLDGQLLELHDGTYEVVLSKSAPHTRKRFTLAHEIAHILVAGDGGVDVTCGDEATEELCNSIAAELLLPGRFLAEVLANGIDVAAIRRIASRFQCSLEATTWRILNMGTVTGALLIWRAAGEDAMELVAAPHTFGFSTPFENAQVLDHTSSLLSALAGQTSGPMEFNDPNSGARYKGDYVRLSKMLLMFIQRAANANTHETASPREAWVQGKLF